MALIGHWKLNEPAGTTGTGSVIDASGSGFHGTPTAVTFGAAGAKTSLGTSAEFVRASSSRIVTTTLGSFGSTAPAFTLAAWVKSSTTNVMMTIMGSQGASGIRLSLYVNEGSGAGAGRIEAILVNSAGQVRGYNNTTNTGVTNGAWHHVAAVIDHSLPVATAGKLYLDGVGITTNSVGNASTTALGGNLAQPMAIGRREGLNDGHWNGGIDDVRIYNEALNAAAVLALFNAGPPAAAIDYLVRGRFEDHP